MGTAAALPPFAAGGLRFLVATSLLWIYIWWKKIALPASAEKWRTVITIGLLSNAASFGIVYWTSQYIPSGLGAVIFGTMPLWTAAIAHYILPEDKLTKTKVFGIFVGVIGIVTIFFPQFSQLNESAIGPMALLLLSPLVSGASAVMTKHSTKEIPAVTINAVTTLVGAVVLSIIALIVEPVGSIQLTSSQLLPILYLSIMGTIVTFGIYFKLIKMTSAVTMSYVSVITPVIAVLLGWIILGEYLDVYEIGGSALVLIGTAISLRM
jgi:drug/metabolite transporter (DMT)-like permease